MALGRYGMDVATMLDRVDENTIGVVPTLGVTYTGIYEDAGGMVAALDDLQELAGLDLDIHVDGASGGFTAPFCAPDLVWDLQLPRVESISAVGAQRNRSIRGQNLQQPGIADGGVQGALASTAATPASSTS